MEMVKEEFNLVELLEGSYGDYREAEPEPDNWFDLLDDRVFEVTSDMEDALRDMDRRKELDERRLSRIADCGNWAYWFDPHAGSMKTYKFRCDLFRECPKCLEQRAKAEFKQWRKVMYEPVAHFTMDSGETDSWLRKAGAKKSDYVRYPQKDGTDVLLVQRDLIPDASLVGPEWYHQQDWTKIMDTPEGRNRSGTLHAGPPPSGKEEYTVITTMQFLTTADWVVTAEAMRQVIEDTGHYRPTEPQHVVSCLTDRTNKTVAKLLAAGYEITIYKKKFKLIHSKISWDNIDIHTENLTKVPLHVLHKRRQKRLVAGLI